MSPKSVSFLAIALVAILAAPVMSAVADADAGQSSGFYRDQLDANGQGLYDEVGATLAALEEAPVNEAKISYTMSSVPSTEADAVSYAQSVVSDALAALYLSDPSHVWLWDYPISNVAIGTSSFDPASGTIAVTFSLAVPDRYADDPETEADELAETIADFRGKIEAFEGDALSIVQSVNNVLRDTRVSDDREATEDQEATVSSPLDALNGESSSAGIAAAFTVLCNASGLECVTVRGYAPSDDAEDGRETAYWNLVMYEGGWYGVDCTLNSEEAKNCLLAGSSTRMVVGGTYERFGGIRAADLDMADPNSLEAPSMVVVGYEWPDDSTFLEKYGLYIILVLMCAIIFGVLIHAMRNGAL